MCYIFIIKLLEITPKRVKIKYAAIMQHETEDIPVK